MGLIHVVNRSREPQHLGDLPEPLPLFSSLPRAMNMQQMFANRGTNRNAIVL